jgi:hypothetical protein
LITTFEWLGSGTEPILVIEIQPVVGEEHFSVIDYLPVGNKKR